jgi:hypothetical protein
MRPLLSLSLRKMLGLAYGGNDMRIMVSKTLAQGGVRTYVSNGIDPVADPASAVAHIVTAVSDVLFQRGRLMLM